MQYNLFSREDIKAISACTSKYILPNPNYTPIFYEWEKILQDPCAIHFIESKLEELYRKYGDLVTNLLYLNPDATHLIDGKKRTVHYVKRSLGKTGMAMKLLEMKKSELEFELEPYNKDIFNSLTSL
jgi:hypothetical protein